MPTKVAPNAAVAASARRLRAVAAVAVVDRHRHRAAAGDQHEGHDRDQDQRHVGPKTSARRPRWRSARAPRRHPHRHVAVRKQPKMKVSLSRKIHIIALPQAPGTSACRRTSPPRTARVLERDHVDNSNRTIRTRRAAGSASRSCTAGRSRACRWLRCRPGRRATAAAQRGRAPTRPPIRCSHGRPSAARRTCMQVVSTVLPVDASAATQTLDRARNSDRQHAGAEREGLTRGDVCPCRDRGALHA
jgi:hypothetical protein